MVMDLEKMVGEKVLDMQDVLDYALELEDSSKALQGTFPVMWFIATYEGKEYHYKLKQRGNEKYVFQKQFENKVGEYRN